jgi:hypothetical protein
VRNGRWDPGNKLNGGDDDELYFSPLWVVRL